MAEMLGRPTLPRLSLGLLLWFPLGCLALLCAGCDAERPMVIICPWSQGGGTDTVSRLVAHLIEKDTDIPVSVVNREGGGGVTGHTAGATAVPDGRTIMMVTVEIGMMHHKSDFTDLSPEHFRPVMLINRDAAALFVRDDSPWKILSDLQRDIEKEPGKLTGSGTAFGGMWHVALAGALLEMEFDADAVVWVPQGGAGPSLQQLMANQLDMVCCSLPEAKSLLGSGRVRALGVMADARIEGFEDVPTFKEQGVDYSLGGWRGLALPGAATDETVARTEAILRRVVDGEDFRKEMKKLGYGIDVEGSVDFAETMRRDDILFGRIMAKIPFESQWTPGPWFFPGALAGFLGLAAIGVLFRRLVRGADEDVAALQVTPGGWVRFGEVLLAVAIYIAIVNTIGFLVTSAVLLVYLCRRLQAGWLSGALVSVLLTCGVYVVFVKLLRVSLPEGLLSF